MKTDCKVTVLKSLKPYTWEKISNVINQIRNGLKK